MISRRSFLLSPPAAAIAAQSKLTNLDDAFLDDLSRRAVQFFWEQADPVTGLVRDRGRSDGSARTGIASIAATGFGLTALCIGADRKWIRRDDARLRAFATLQHFATRAVHKNGWFYHFVDPATGDRRWNCEVSSIDTALLLGGILTAGRYFGDDAGIARLARQIYERVDFQWMLNGHPTLLAHGWTPEKDFIQNRWDTYCELAILYVLGINSPTHPIPPDSWYAWTRPWVAYRNYRYAGGAPLFTHQYSHAWIDFRNQREDHGARIDYFKNSIVATHAHRAFCIDLHAKFADYSEDQWGITASDSAKGYVAWGGPPMDHRIDGTLVPCAAGGSLMFAPRIALSALRAMHERFGDKIYGRYGFVDAFNPLTGWIDSDVLGIDQGITLLSAENLRSQSIWRWLESSPLHTGRLPAYHRYSG